MYKPDAQRGVKRTLSALNVDLNLLVVLHALLEEKSVTRAARRVCLSQSATSSALARLRAVFDDQLLVRRSNHMELTRRGTELKEPVTNAIDAISAVLGEPQPFDPDHAHMTIRIGASDYIGVTLLPALERQLQDQAPGISLKISPPREPDVFQRLENDDLDLLIGHFPHVPKLQCTEIFNETFACLMRAAHPLALEFEGQPLTVDQFVAYSHVATARAGVQEDLIDKFLDECDAERTIGIQVPHFLVAASIVASNDMIAVQPQRIASLFKDTFDLTAVALPREFGTVDLPIHMVWEPHTEDNPALEWIRSLIKRVALTI